jgi:hypothetical protein
MNVDAILQRLKGVKRNGAGWIARCPAHADKSPSLSIREENGRVLFHCFAGCTLEAICSALGIRISDLFSQPRAFKKPEPPAVRDAQKHIAELRSRLTPRDREREVTVVLANESNLEKAMARALALAVEGELVQLALEREAE